MQETIEQILGYLRGIWRRRWLVIGIAWSISLVGWIWVYLLQNEYKAEARVYVDTQSLLKPLLAGLAVQPNVEQQVSMMTRTLLSRPNLEKVARMTDMDLGAKDQKRLEALYKDLTSRITLEGTDRENLYTISFIHANPDLGKRVVQSLLSIFTESSLGSTRQDLSQSQKFIEEQLQGYETKLRDKEKQLEAFKRRNVGNLPNQGGADFYSKLNEVNASIQQAKLDLEESLNRKRQLQQQLEDQEETISAPSPSMVSNSATDSRISTLQSQLDTLRLRYTDLHPEVQRVKQLIASLQEQKRKEEVDLAKASQGSAKAQNPVYQQLSIAIAEADAQTAQLRARVNQLSARRAELMRSIDLIPQLEAEYTQLTRDYEVYRKNYAELLDRRETAVITKDVESKTSAVDFRVIDPPRVSHKPARPNRPLLISAVPFGGLSLGIAVAFLLVQVRPTVDGRRQLRELTGLQPLGVVTMIETDDSRAKQRRMNWLFIVASAGLAAMYAVLLVYYTILSPAA